MTPAVTGFFFVGINIALWLCVLAVQGFESRAGRIVPRQRWGSAKPFLYFQDWNMVVWGDWIGLSLIDFVVGSSAAQSNTSMLVFAAAVGFAGAMIFHVRSLSARHRPDAQYPAAHHVSLSGRMHLLYFFLQSGACGFALALAWQGIVQGSLLALAVVGGIIYLASFAADWYQGKLTPITI